MARLPRIATEAQVGRFQTDPLPGFGERLGREIVAKRDRPPAVDLGLRRCAAEARDARWVEPVHVAEVEFTAWTRQGHIRHPSFKGMREDKPTRQVTAE